MKAEVTREHRWLEQLVGDWTYENESSCGPDQPAQKFTGTERVRSMGGVWVVAEGEGRMPDGGTGQMLLTIGYNPKTKRYMGTWIGSMMHHLWVYDGFLDETGRILTLESQGPSFTDPAKTDTYRDIIEIVGPNTRTLASKMRNDKGEWTAFMQATYTRAAR